MNGSKYSTVWQIMLYESNEILRDQFENRMVILFNKRTGTLHKN
jgi:hypothetical protein